MTEGFLSELYFPLHFIFAAVIFLYIVDAS
jgi:hypothetical protein